MKTCLLLTVILIVNNSVTARDGCGNKKSRNREIKCGDKCGDDCSCGRAQFARETSRNWCCVNNTTCTTVDRNNNDRDKVSCERGKFLSLTEPCNGECNFWPEYVYRNWGVSRSHVKCETGDQCINEEKMCTGRAVSYTHLTLPPNREV